MLLYKKTNNFFSIKKPCNHENHSFFILNSFKTVKVCSDFNRYVVSDAQETGHKNSAQSTGVCLF